MHFFRPFLKTEVRENLHVDFSNDCLIIKQLVGKIRITSGHLTTKWDSNHVQTGVGAQAELLFNGPWRKHEY